jgi:hypothetical protein
VLALEAAIRKVRAGAIPAEFCLNDLILSIPRLRPDPILVLVDAPDVALDLRARDLTGMSDTNPIPNTKLIPRYSETFDFPVAGAYSPTLVIHFTNYTSFQTPLPSPAQYTFSDIKVPVASFIDIQNAKNGRIQTALTYIIVLFVFLEGLSIMIDLTGKKKDDDSQL